MGGRGASANGGKYAVRISDGKGYTQMFVNHLGGNKITPIGMSGIPGDTYKIKGGLKAITTRAKDMGLKVESFSKTEFERMTKKNQRDSASEAYQFETTSRIGRRIARYVKSIHKTQRRGRPIGAR